MSRGLARAPSPDALILALRRRELSALRAEMIGRERALDQLRAQLHSFEGRYIRQVGVLYRQLDEWETRIAQLQVSRESMEETERLLREALKKANEANFESSKAPEPSIDLKNLFREVAKRIHPDFATDHLDERQRTRLMAQANEAFRREDANLLQRMLNGYDPTTDSYRHEDTSAALARTKQQIAQTSADIVTLDAELATLAQSDMAQLRQRTLDAAVHGRDLLAEIAAQVKGSIGIAMRRYELDLIRARRNEAAFNPDPLLSQETPPPSSRR